MSRVILIREPIDALQSISKFLFGKLVHLTMSIVNNDAASISILLRDLHNYSQKKTITILAISMRQKGSDYYACFCELSQSYRNVHKRYNIFGIDKKEATVKPDFHQCMQQ